MTEPAVDADNPAVRSRGKLRRHLGIAAPVVALISTACFGTSGGPLIGTSPSVSLPARPSIPADWKTYQGAGFSIALPSAWQQKQGGSGTAFEALLDVSSVPLEAAFLGVGTESVPDNDIAAYAQSMLVRTKGSPNASSVKMTFPFPLPAGIAAKYEFRNDPTGGLPEAHTLYLLINDRTGYGIDFITDPNVVESLRPSFEQIVSTFWFGS